MSESVTYARRSERLQSWMEARHLSQADIGRRTGKAKSYISSLLGGTKPFGERVAREIEGKLLMPKSYLDGPEESGLETVTTWERPEELPQGVYAMVPRVSIRLSAGGGAVVEKEEELPPLAFREDWLRKKRVTSKSALRICEVTGDSMMPYLEDGDVVMIDTGQIEIKDLAVYVIRYGDELRIKRLSRRFDGGLIIRSDNPRYPEEQIAFADVHQIQVLGALVWRGG
jgi:phage repressor protein C with HTH and peptisase S24 domain